MEEEDILQSPLLGVAFHRIILDQADAIKNHKTNQVLASFQLRGTNRLVLTDAPFQNGKVNIYPFLRFLRATPFDLNTVWMRLLGKSTKEAVDRLRLLVGALFYRPRRVFQPDAALHMK